MGVNEKNKIDEQKDKQISRIFLVFIFSACLNLGQKFFLEIYQEGRAFNSRSSPKISRTPRGALGEKSTAAAPERPARGGRDEQASPRGSARSAAQAALALPNDGVVAVETYRVSRRWEKQSLRS